MKKDFLKLSKVITISILTVFVLTACSGTEKSPGKYAEVAKCLTEKGVVLYGAYWCKHCQAQRADFGADAQFIKYTECDDNGENGNRKACLEAGVTSFPTWAFPGQGNLVGRNPIFVIAKLANCQDKLPQEDLEKLKNTIEETGKITNDMISKPSTTINEKKETEEK